MYQGMCKWLCTGIVPLHQCMCKSKVSSTSSSLSKNDISISSSMNIWLILISFEVFFCCCFFRNYAQFTIWWRNPALTPDNHGNNQMLAFYCHVTTCGSLRKRFAHSGWMTHICIGNLTIIGSDNGLLPGQHQAIVWTSAGVLLIWSLGTNFNEILNGIQAFSFKKMQLKVLSGKWQPFRLGVLQGSHGSLFPWKVLLNMGP